MVGNYYHQYIWIRKFSIYQKWNQHDISIKWSASSYLKKSENVDIFEGIHSVLDK